jgi:hypothetical protein
MIFKQFYLPCLAHASYLIGDESTGTAAVIDPQRDTDQYLAFAAEHALTIKQGFLRVREIAGGIVAWEAARLPVQSAPALT